MDRLKYNKNRTDEYIETALQGIEKNKSCGMIMLNQKLYNWKVENIQKQQ